jgi:DNA transformation protein
MGELSKIINIGKKLEKQLEEVGIQTFEELKNIGSKEVWLKIYDIDSSVCYSKLCALEGAIQDIRWHNLSNEDKNKLKKFYNDVKTKK